jgi:hypothetical protein
LRWCDVARNSGITLIGTRRRGFGGGLSVDRREGHATLDSSRPRKRRSGAGIRRFMNFEDLANL